MTKTASLVVTIIIRAFDTSFGNKHIVYQTETYEHFYSDNQKKVTGYQTLEAWTATFELQMQLNLTGSR